MTWFCAVGIHAQERTIDQVKNEVISFFASDSSRAQSILEEKKYRDKIEVTNLTRGDTTYLYIVNMPDSGWAVVSNEQRYPMIVGYSTTSHFDTNLENQPGALRWLLQHHMNMIDSLRESPSTFYSRTSSPSPLSHPLIVPSRDLDTILLKRGGHVNQWNQSSNNGSEIDSCNKVYNKFCPVASNGKCGHTLVGCTAVAIGQILWYWHWPDYAMISDTIHAGVPSGQERKHYYDWDSIPCSIDNHTSMYKVNMVAGLLRDCGYAAWMLYGASNSLAGPVNLENALENTFNFHVHSSFDLSNSTLAPLLQYEIQQMRPVICQGTGPGWGNIHSFVIDGYSSISNKYHINWGWGESESDILTSMWDLGFNGYASARTFFTELYPDCSARLSSITDLDISIIEAEKDVTLYSTYNISLNNLLINNSGHLNISAGNVIYLGNGFNAQKGSYVKIAPNYNCATGTSSAPVSIPQYKGISINNAKENTILSVTPNPVVNELNISCSTPIETIYIFNIHGQCLLQTTQEQINVSFLPQGIYIVRVITTNSVAIQSKIIHL